MKQHGALGIFAMGIALSGIVLGGCTKKNVEDEKISTITLGLRSDVKTLDPADAYDEVSNDVTPSIYESLYQYSYLTDDVEVEPLLAADMPKYSADRLTLTIPIKKGVKFANDPCFKATNGKGREVTANDFIYEFKRLAHPGIRSQGFWIFDNKVVGINAFHDKLVQAKSKEEIQRVFNEPIEGFKALDDHTLQIKLMKPYPELKYILTMGFTAAVPKEAVDAYADESGNLTDKPVGSGPFMLKTWNRNQDLILVRNPDYHADFYPTQASSEYQKRGMLSDAGKPLPFVDRLIFQVSEEQQPSWLNFMKGTQDAIRIPKDNYKQAIVNRTNLTPEFSAKGARLTIETGVAFYYISFNMNDKLIGGNKLLRQALSAAINRDEFIDVFTNGTGQKQVNAVPPGIADRPKNTTLKYDFDLVRAKELLAKAGYPGGKGLPVLKFDTRSADSVSRQMGDFFRQQWGAIGVQIDVTLNTFPAFLQKMKEGNLQVSYGGWNLDYPDAENVYQLLYGPNSSPGPNEANFNNLEMNKLYEQMAVMESSPKREAIIQKMDAIQQEEVPWALLYYHARYDLSHPWILNYRAGDIIQNRQKYFRLDKGVKKRYLSGGS